MNPQTSKIAYLVVVGQIMLSIIIVGSICACLFYKSYADPATLTALIVLAGTLVGNLGSLLGGPQRMPPPPDITVSPAKVEVTQQPNEKKEP